MEEPWLVALMEVNRTHFGHDDSSKRVGVQSELSISNSQQTSLDATYHLSYFDLTIFLQRLDHKASDVGRYFFAEDDSMFCSRKELLKQGFERTLSRQLPDRRRK